MVGVGFGVVGLGVGGVDGLGVGGLGVVGLGVVAEKQVKWKFCKILANYLYTIDVNSQNYY